MAEALFRITDPSGTSLKVYESTLTLGNVNTADTMSFGGMCNKLTYSELFHILCDCRNLVSNSCSGSSQQSLIVSTDSNHTAQPERARSCMFVTQISRWLQRPADESHFGKAAEQSVMD
ncbi:hypothetical protein ABVT39_013354 [Epinephelus coioides]